MGFAILWVMLFHFPLNLTPNNPLGFIQNIGYGGVDIFFFLSGFGLYFSLSRDGFTLKEYYKNRFARILPEFWLVLTLLFVASVSFDAPSFLSYICKASTLGYWLCVWDAPLFLWYISAILGFYAIYPMFFRCFKKYGLIAPIVAICVGLVLIVLYALISVFAFDNENVGSLLILSIARIPIFFMGSIFGYWVKSKQTIVLSVNMIRLFVAVAIISLLALYVFINYLPEYLWTCSLYFVPFIVITPVLCMFLAYAFKLSGKLNVIFSYFGVFSLEIYLCHESIFELVSMASTPVGKIILSLLVVVLSLVCARILYHINNRFIQRLFR